MKKLILTLIIIAFNATNICQGIDCPAREGEQTCNVQNPCPFDQECKRKLNHKAHCYYYACVCPKARADEQICEDNSDCPDGQVCSSRWNGKSKCYYKACGKKNEFKIS